MSFFEGVTGEIKKTAATKIAGAVVGTATLVATGATVSYFAKSSPTTTENVALTASQDPAPAGSQNPAPAPPPKLPAPAVAASATTPQSAVVGGVTVEYQADYGSATASDSKDASDQAQEFLASKGWVEGKNPNGMFVAIGKASLPCGSDSGKFDECRRQAFSQAMFSAKRSLANYLALEISASMSSTYREGDVLKQLTQSRAQQTSAPRGLTQKVALLANSFIDEELKSRGVNFGEEQSAQAEAERKRAADLARKDAEQLISSSEFKSAVNVAAMTDVSAVQAYRTFEYIAPGAKGSIGVVAIYSEKSGQLQQALLGLVDLPAGAPKEAIGKWAAAQGASTLLYTFGVQPRVDEKGELVLVAFGQGSPIGNSERQLDAAEQKAGIDAQRAARFFLGELVASEQQQVEASTLKDFSDNSSTYQSQSSYEELMKATADKLSLPGGNRVYRWKLRHPLSDKTTVGAVYVFSVSEALNANKLRDQFKAAGGAAGGKGISTKRPVDPAPPSKPEQKRSLTGGSGTGTEGDEP